MKLLLAYIDVYLKEMLRNYTAAFFTLLFPMVLFQLFGLNEIAKGTDKVVIVSLYCNYAVQTVMFQALGITISMARSNPWSDFIRFLPYSHFPMLLGRIVSNLIFTAFALFCVMTLSQFNHLSSLPWSDMFLIMLGAILTGVPMAIFAIFLGNLLNASAAKSAFVLINLLLLLGAAGTASTSFWRALINLVPSYQSLVFTMSLAKHDFSFVSLSWLIVFSIFFLLLYCATKENFFRTFFQIKFLLINHFHE